jgi:hypothetical protein
MMVLTLPHGVLSLGRHLDAPSPALLTGAVHPGLDRFLKAHDPCVDATGDCGARDWCDLGQRMHYIVHLFRAHADDARLFTRPFTPEQVARFRADTVPEGDL